MNKPKVSKDFTVEDIRKIRDYNGQRLAGWSDEDIIRETQNNVKELREYLEQNKPKKVIQV
jgi:DNA topoisomerase IB